MRKVVLQVTQFGRYYWMYHLFKKVSGTVVAFATEIMTKVVYRMGRAVAWALIVSY